MRWRLRAFNAVLVTASFVCAYLLLEPIFFRALLPHVSLNIKTHLPDIAGVLVQNSKAALIPHDYVAILGDSYAEGVGDWLLQARGDRSKPFHSANVIHESTGRDVVSFGRVGSSSAEAMVTRPAYIFGSTACYFFPEIEPPREMFIYFYEGNDIEDNNRYLSSVAKKYGNASDAMIDRLLNDDATGVWWWKCRKYLGDTLTRMGHFLFQYHVQGLSLDPSAPLENRVIVAGREVEIPSIQGPGMCCDDQQIEAALRVFDRSLDWLKKRFPGVPTTVIYVPAPGSVYRFAGTEIVTRLGRRPAVMTTPTEVAKRSDLMCAIVRRYSLSHDTAFVDARPALRRAAEGRLIHGPIDWAHFNETGYRVLGNLVVDGLQDHPGVP